MVFYGSCFEPAVIDRHLKREPGPRGMSAYADYDSVIARVNEALTPGPYLLGERFSAADILWGGALGWTMGFGLVEPAPGADRLCRAHPIPPGLPEGRRRGRAARAGTRSGRVGLSTAGLLLRPDPGAGSGAQSGSPPRSHAPGAPIARPEHASPCACSLPMLAALLLGAPAQAGEPTGTLRKIQDNNRLVLGVRDTATPFSYLDQNQKVVGFAVDICLKIADAVKRELKRPDLEVAMEFVNSSSRIPLITNGTVDLECGTTTNNAERKKQVDFTNTHFLTATRFVSKKDQHIASLDDLRGKAVASVAGSTNILMLIKANNERKLGITVIAAKDVPEAFLLVETGRAAAFVMDDVQLSVVAAQSKDPVRLRGQPGDPVEPGALRDHAAPGRSGLQGGGRPGDRRSLPQPRDHDDLRSLVPEAGPAARANYNVPLSSGPALGLREPDRQFGSGLLRALICRRGGVPLRAGRCDAAGRDPARVVKRSHDRQHRAGPPARRGPSPRRRPRRSRA